MPVTCGVALPFEEALFDWLHRAYAFAGDRSIVKSVRSVLPPEPPVIRYLYRGDGSQKLPLFLIPY